MKRILICGPGRSGKDTAGEYLESVTDLRFAGTTSLYGKEFVGRKLGIPPEEAYRRRHESDEMRDVWFHTLNEVREGDPTILIRMALDHGEITGGIRDKEEVVGAREHDLFDVIIWIHNTRCKADKTMKFGSEMCDIVIENNWTKEEFHQRLYRFAKLVGILKPEYGQNQTKSGHEPDSQLFPFEYLATMTI